jgi:hypothetical protein
MTERAVLSFVRTDGGARRVKVGGILDEVVVGRTRSLEDTDGAVMHLVHRIVVHRCQTSRACV